VRPGACASDVVAVSIRAERDGWSARARDYVSLTKPRLNFLVLLTTLAGVYLAVPGGVASMTLVHTLVGSALVAGGAAALNQAWERDSDRLMRRTRWRPIPSGRLHAAEATWFGLALSAGGIADLALAVNALCASVATVTLVSYLLVYTPLKRRTPLSTLAGAVPGALPPLIGWTAATNDISPAALVLVAIVVFWQIPHFLAIAWLYRDDYARAGIPLLPVREPDGRRTGQAALVCAALLWPVSLMAAVAGLGGPTYSLAATFLGLAFIWVSALFARERSARTARRLFVFSIAYLPLLWGVLVADRLLR
jgi:heme o synthase